MWSPSVWVGSRCVTLTPCRSTASCSGSSGAPESTKTAVPPGSSPTRYAFESQLGCMLRSTITAARLTRRTATRRADGRVARTDDDSDQGEVLEAPEPSREAFRDARLLVRAAAGAAPEREARRRGRRYGEETARASNPAARAERRQARHAGTAGPRRRPRGSCARGAGAKVRGPAAAAGPRRSDQGARGAAGEARRQRAATVGARRVVPLREGSDQGAVLRRR